MELVEKIGRGSNAPKRVVKSAIGTKHLFRSNNTSMEAQAPNLSSRPERSGVEGPALRPDQQQHFTKAAPLSDLSSRPKRSEGGTCVAPDQQQDSTKAVPLSDLSSRPERSGVEGPALRPISNNTPLKLCPLSDLSSRPERSEVEGPALRPTSNNTSLKLCPSQICHPDRSAAEWRDLRCARPATTLH